MPLDILSTGAVRHGEDTNPGGPRSPARLWVCFPSALPPFAPDCDALEGPFKFQILRVASRAARTGGGLYNHLIAKRAMCGARQIPSSPRVRTPPPPSLGPLGFANTGCIRYNGAAPPTRLGLQDLLAPPSLAIRDRLGGNLSWTCLPRSLPEPGSRKTPACLPFTFLTLALVLCPSAYDGLGARRGRSLGIFQHWLCRQSPNKCVL